VGWGMKDMCYFLLVHLIKVTFLIDVNKSRSQKGQTKEKGQSK
jgi:hypothetical protein